VAERVPALVREIAARGHEIASHGQSHEMCTQLEEERIRQDLDRSRKLLEDLMGAAVRGYRAPSFSVSPKVLEIAREAGYVYDSSYNSFSGHGRYGQIDLSRSQKTGRAYRIGSGFYELPVSNLRIAGKVIPLGGGGYFRLIPWPAFRSGIRRILAQEGAYMFYCHPWEIDPEQPRVLQSWSRAGFKHYVNLGDTEKRIRRMLHAFAGCDFVSCSQYLRHALEGEGGRVPGGSALTEGSACSRV
jgi:polysaccharide deacetylase family protein (PEP-CTERM system associated)